MRKFKNLLFDERYLFKDLLLSDTCKKKNEIIRSYVKNKGFIKTIKKYP